MKTGNKPLSEFAPGWERSWAIMIEKHAGTYLKDIVSIYTCTVDSVDEGKRTCDCTAISGNASTPIPGVQLMAESDNGLVVFPTIGSTVIVALSKYGTAFVVMYSSIDKFNLQTAKGGILNIDDLIQIKNDYDSLKDIMSELVNQMALITVSSFGAVPNNAVQILNILPRINTLLK